MPDELTFPVEAYALKAVLAGAESYIEDDLDEDGELPDGDDHKRAIDFGYALLNAIRYHRTTLLDTAREYYAAKDKG